MTQLPRTLANPDGVHTPVGRYSHLAQVRSGELLFLAGQVGVDAEGILVGKGDAGAQTAQVFENIGEVLSSAGATFENVVQLTTYVVGRDSLQPYLDARTEIFSEIYPKGGYPPNTLLVISGLVDERMLVEITAVAASRVPGSGVRGRGSGERETTASSLAGKEESSRKEDNSGQGKDGPAGAIAQGGNGR